MTIAPYKRVDFHSPASCVTLGLWLQHGTHCKQDVDQGLLQLLNVHVYFRATLSALVVMDVHARDVVTTLATEGIEGQLQHFSWLSQLRMYWEQPSAGAESTDPTIIVRMMNAQVRVVTSGTFAHLCIMPLGFRLPESSSVSDLFFYPHCILGFLLVRGQTPSSSSYCPSMLRFLACFAC